MDFEMKNSRIEKLDSISVLMLSTGYEPLFKTDWKKAVSAVFGGRAEIIEFHESLSIKTSSGDYPLPTKVRFLSGVFIGKIKKFSRVPRPTKKNLWLRDKAMCQYCSKKITLASCTIDHVIPKSKGGKHVWSNIVLACSSCNQRKGSSLLENTDMKILNNPTAPYYFDQKIF